MKKALSMVFMLLIIVVLASVSFAAQNSTITQTTTPYKNKKIGGVSTTSGITVKKTTNSTESILTKKHYDIDAALKKMKEEAAAKADTDKADKGKKEDESKKTIPVEANKNKESDQISKIITTKTSDTKQPISKDNMVSPKDVVKAVEVPLAVGSAGTAIKPTPMIEGELETAESLLVTSEWLVQNLSKVVIVDARPESLYAGGHIPGAVNASWTYFANVNAPAGSMKYGTIYNPATMAKRIGALGIDGKKPVVVYCDAGGWGQSGWALWVLRMSGIKNAKILDGGFTAWKQPGRVVSRTKHTNKAVPFTIASYKANYLVNTEWIKNNIGKPNLAILDVRTSGEYLGKIRPFGEKRAGHLPGAINIEMGKFINADHSFKSQEEIAELMQSAGISPDTEIVVYDTAGVRAAFVTMVLRYASGYNKTQCYDEGFQAWAGDPTLPIEKTE
ncbi:MAG: sulfurtransferase [Synergistaceae bacterium]|nr:sulfurtransferase [Synergistaceae bacterium]